MALNERYQMMLEKCVSSLQTWQNSINEHLDGEEKATEEANLKSLAKEYCIIDNNHQKSQKALEIVRAKVQDPQKDYDIDQMFKSAINQQEDEDITNNEVWTTLFKNRHSVQEIKPKQKKDTAQYETVQQDDSVLCSNAFSAPLDPISKVVIRNPVRNKKCNHVYEKDSIYAYIRQSKRKAKCPYMGCNNNSLVPEDLRVDDALGEQISQFLQTQQDEDSSDSDSN